VDTVHKGEEDDDNDNNNKCICVPQIFVPGWLQDCQHGEHAVNVL
jgi:hypothetical protein